MGTLIRVVIDVIYSTASCVIKSLRVGYHIGGSSISQLLHFTPTSKLGIPAVKKWADYT